MKFTEQDKLKALAIVHIFETSRPLGDYTACVVLNDGAGVSYGINQFTHRSGSLESVVTSYLMDGGTVGADVLVSRLATLRQRTAAAIAKLSSDAEFKRALRAAAVTTGMKAAQRRTAFERYLRPALQICDARGFSQTLSLAVIYDSVTHGSWERLSTTVGKLRDEKAWITAYVRKRHLWLTNVPRLRVTNYRTKFFLDQIATGNWELHMPLNVHGYRLLTVGGETAGGRDAESAGRSDEQTEHLVREAATMPSQIGEAIKQDTSIAREGALLDSAQERIGVAVDRFDRVEAAANGIVERKDAAKSLWTTVGGTLWQAAWAVFGFVAGLPKEVWIVVAIVAALLMLAYLYRQTALGKIREQAHGEMRGEGR